MIKIENECVDCPTEMGCLGDSCSKKNVVHLYCDNCGEDVEKLFDVGGEQICESCLQERFQKIDYDNYGNYT